MTNQSRFDALANLPFEKNRPTAATAQTLKDELIFQRATQTYLWAMPLINTMGMKTGSEKQFSAGYNVVGAGPRLRGCLTARGTARLPTRTCVDPA